MISGGIKLIHSLKFAYCLKWSLQAIPNLSRIVFFTEYLVWNHSLRKNVRIRVFYEPYIPV